MRQQHYGGGCSAMRWQHHGERHQWQTLWGEMLHFEVAMLWEEMLCHETAKLWEETTMADAAGGDVMYDVVGGDVDGRLHGRRHCTMRW